jgi:hypothetical protein
MIKTDDSSSYERVKGLLTDDLKKKALHASSAHLNGEIEDVNEILNEDNALKTIVNLFLEKDVATHQEALKKIQTLTDNENIITVKRFINDVILNLIKCLQDAEPETVRFAASAIAKLTINANNQVVGYKVVGHLIDLLPNRDALTVQYATQALTNYSSKYSSGWMIRELLTFAKIDAVLGHFSDLTDRYASSLIETLSRKSYLVPEFPQLIHFIWFLYSNDIETTRNMTQAFSNFSKGKELRNTLREQLPISAFLRLFLSNDTLTVRYASELVRDLTIYNERNYTHLHNVEIIKSLVSLLKSHDNRTVKNVVHTIYKLSHFDTVRDMICKEGALPILITILSNSENNQCKQYARDAIKLLSPCPKISKPLEIRIDISQSEKAYSQKDRVDINTAPTPDATFRSTLFSRLPVQITISELPDNTKNSREERCLPHVDLK